MRQPKAIATPPQPHLALAIFVIALAARLIFLFNSPDRDWPHSAFYEGDAVMWVEWANALDEGTVFQFDLPIHPPAVAYAIAYLYDGVRISGFLGMKVLWCAMSAAACAFTFLACAQMMSRRIALLASLLLAFSFGQYVLTTSLNSETPYVMLLSAMVWLTQIVVSRPRFGTVALLGALHGLAMLLRAEHPLLLMMLLLWMLCAKPRLLLDKPSIAPLTLRKRLVCVTTLVGFALLICMPWTVHAVLATNRYNTIEIEPVRFNLAPIEWTPSAQNALNELPSFAHPDVFVVLNHWAQAQGLEVLNSADVDRYFTEEFGWTPRTLTTMILVSNQGALSFALANHPDCDGGFSRAALAHPVLGDDPEFAFAFPPHNRVFNDGWRVGWRFITQDFDAWLKLVGRKFQRFADGVTSGFGARNLPLNREGVREPVDMFISDSGNARWWQPLVLSMIALGITLALARRIPCSLWLLILLNKIIITLAFYGYARQGASIAPAFAVLIAIALDTMLLPLDRWTPRWMRWQAPIIIAICAGALISDVALSRRGDRMQIDGLNVKHPELGQGAFQAFNRIEVRAEP